MKVLFVTGVNQYGVIDYFFSSMQQDLLKLGFHSSTIQLSNTTSFNLDPEELSCDLIVSFNGLGADLMVEGKKLFTVIGKPVLIFLVDHPMHVLGRLLGLNCTLLCVDKSHVQFANLCGMKAHLFPHALASEQLNESKFLPFDAKRDEIILPCSYQNKAGFKKALEPLWAQIAPLLEKSRNIYHLLLLLGVLPQQDQPPRMAIDANVLALITHADLYLRAISREAAIQKGALLNSNLSLKLVGRGVRQYNNEYLNIEMKESISVDDLLTEISSSLYLLHNVPGFSAALHERLLFAIAAGTNVICDDSNSVAQVAPEIKLLDLSSFHTLSESTYDEIRLSNLNIVKENHTWLVRFSKLFELVSL